jgi:ubiquinone/menaquinone biosynthesis C-methylase UbiE
MTWQVWQNAEVAGRFVDTRRGGMLGADEQFRTMLDLLRYVRSESLTVLDIGCGDGVVLETLMRAYPVSRAVAFDGSPAMLEKAQVRFEELGLFAGLVEFVEGDFDRPDWRQRLPIRTYDAIVSAFAIHHSEDDRKRALYAEIFEMLRPGGLFLNIEHVASATPLGEELFERAYAETLAGFRRSRGIETSPEEVYRELNVRPDKSANRLSPVEEQLRWLREIGFRDVDCYWKQYELAVLAGFRA